MEIGVTFALQIYYKTIKMLSKSKIKKLGKELKSLGYSKEAIAKEANTNRVMLDKVLNGKSYKLEIIKSMIELRDTKLSELKKIEASI